MVNRNDDSAGRTPIEERSKELFDESVAGLNGNIRSRLTQARHAALATLKHQPPAWSFRRWMPVTAASAAALLVVAAFFAGIARQPLQDANLAADDMTLLLNGDNLDLIEEIEFYAWLDNEALLDGDAGPAGEIGTDTDTSRS